MITIYFKTHQNRIREAQFFTVLSSQFSEAIVRNENFQIDSFYLEKFVDTRTLIIWLNAEKLLPKRRSQNCIQILNRCPDQLKVALKPSQISFDIVIVKNQQPYYWEFHEEQHRKWKKSKTSKVYASDSTAIEVPRYVQRLIRDVWRVLYFRPYTIVWSDWFEYHQTTYNALLKNGFQEFHNQGMFSFQEFCRISRIIGNDT